MKTKWFLSLLLSFFIFFTNVNASNVAKVGETEYSSIEGALAAASSGDVITITDNAYADGLTLESGITLLIPAGKEIILTGKSTVKSGAIVNNNGTIIVDNGILDVSKLSYGAKGLVPSQSGKITIKSKGTLISLDAWYSSVNWSPTTDSHILVNIEKGALVVSGPNYYLYDGSNWIGAFELVHGTEKNNYVTLNLAINAAIDGDIINIPQGEFYMSAPITITKGITILGQGIEKTIIRGNLNTTTPQAFILNMGGAKKTFTLKDIHFTEFGGNLNNRGGIVDVTEITGNAETNIKIENVKITKFSRQAIRVRSGSIELENVIVDGEFPSSEIKQQAINNSWYRTAIELDGSAGKKVVGVINNSTIKNIRYSEKDEFGLAAYGGWENTEATITNTVFENCEQGVSVENYYVTDISAISEGKIIIDSNKPNVFKNCIFHYKINKILFPDNYVAVENNEDAYGWYDGFYYYYYQNYGNSYDNSSKKYSSITSALENANNKTIAVVAGTYEETNLLDEYTFDSTVYLTFDKTNYKALVLKYGEDSVKYVTTINNKYALSSLNSNDVPVVETEINVINKENFAELKNLYVSDESNEKIGFQTVDNTGKVISTWVFEAKDIEKTNIDLNLNINILSEKPNTITSDVIDKEKKNLFVDFEHDGDFPGKAKITLYVGSKYNAGEAVILNYYNSVTKKLETINDYILVDKDGYVTFEITHASTYVLTQTQVRNPKTSDNILIYMLLGIMGSSGIIFILNKMKKTN